MKFDATPKKRLSGAANEGCARTPTVMLTVFGETREEEETEYWRMRMGWSMERKAESGRVEVGWRSRRSRGEMRGTRMEDS